MQLRYTVPENQSGRSLLNILRQEMRLSATAVKRLKVPGGIMVGGVQQFTNYRVAEGDVVTADLTLSEPETDIVPEPGPLDILYEDEAILAVNKPPGLLVHPSWAVYAGTLANFASSHCGVPCHAVNRLDKDTSGVVLYAKNSHVKALAIESLKTSEKLYTAVVLGRPENCGGCISLPIKREREGLMRRVTAPDGIEARTLFKTLATAAAFDRPITSLELRLMTGRTHQIRVHLLSAGLPILGDPMYSNCESARLSAEMGLVRQLLHALSLRFCHPMSGTPLTITAPVNREDMRGVLGLFKS